MKTINFKVSGESLEQIGEPIGVGEIRCVFTFDDIWKDYLPIVEVQTRYETKYFFMDSDTEFNIPKDIKDKPYWRIKLCATKDGSIEFSTNSVLLRQKGE